jgi:hypothetical protein
MEGACAPPTCTLPQNMFKLAKTRTFYTESLVKKILLYSIHQSDQREIAIFVGIAASKQLFSDSD